MSTPRLEMRGITKRFPGVTALDGVDFAVADGEVVALIGENGAGKSTLMNILGGVVPADAGAVRMDGRPAEVRSVRDAVHLGIGFIHQELNLFDNLDVAGNIFIGREPVRGGPLGLIDPRRMYTEADVWTRRIGLGVPSHTPVGRLSLAQQQLVEIAKALSLNARLLIMDEPTSSLTLAETDRLLQVVRDLRAQGVSVIYISHRLGEVEALADCVAVLRDGRNAGELARGEITHDRMIRMMVGRDLDQFYARPTGGRREAFLEVEGLRTRRYPQAAVSFSVARGEVLCLAGLIGAGRTELAQALFGTEPALGGTIRLGGALLQVRTPADALAHGLCLVPEDRRHLGLIVEQTVRENISLPSLRRYARAGWVARAGEAKAAAGLCERLRVRTPSVEARAGNLSGGNQQKVVLAKWLSMNPRVLILDEPTRGIDVGAKAEIYELMRELAGGGVAVIVISSDMEEVLGVSDRVAVMRRGRITGVLERDQCREEAVMRLAVS